MTDQPTNNNGFWKGRTEASIEGLAHTLDEIKSQIGLNCPIGQENSNRIHELELGKGRWLDTIIAIAITAIATAAATKLL